MPSKTRWRRCRGPCESRTSVRFRCHVPPGAADVSNGQRADIDRRRVPASAAALVDPFDYDGDGDTDVLVAEFGWRKTGALRLLRNVGGDLRLPKMQIEDIDL